MSSISKHRANERQKTPQGWDLTELGNIAEITMGQSPAGATYNATGAGMPLINGPAEFGNLYPTPVQWTTKPTKVCRVGDILFCVRGNTAGRMNRADQAYCIGRGISAIRESPQRATTEFIYYLLEHHRPTIYRIGAGGGSTFPNIGFHDLSSYKVTLPPFSEQQEIVTILSTVDNSIQKSDQIITKTQQLKKGLMQQLFTRGIGHTEFSQTEVGEIPIEWKARKLGDCVEIKGGHSFKSNEYTNEGTPLIRITNVSHGAINMDDVAFLPNSFLKKYGEFSLEEGDLVIVLTRPITGGGIKAARIERKHLPALLNQRIGKIRIKHKENLQPGYLFHLIFSRAFINQVRIGLSLMNQPNISPREIEEFRIPLPPVDEQLQISEILSTIDRKIETENKHRQGLHKIKTGLMSTLLTGKIRVKES